MRFNKRNWIKFFDGSNKKTTLRLKKSKIGHHKAYAGSRSNPTILGEFDIYSIKEIKFKNLTNNEAQADGFDDVELLVQELITLNGKIDSDTLLYQHWIKNAVNKKEDYGIL